MTTDRPISIAAGVSPELAADPVGFVEHAAAAGWRAAGIWFDPDSWEVGTARRVADRLDATGLVAVDMEVIRIGSSSDHGDRIVDAAAELGVPNLLAISSFPDHGATAERLAALCERAAPAGIRVCIEFMRLTEVKNLSDALEVVRLADHPGAGILVDLIHVARSETPFDQIAAADPRLFPYAQWCDAPAEPRGWGPQELLVDALDDRSIPNEGGLDSDGFQDLFAAKVPFSIEVRSRALRERFPDHTERAAHLLAGTTAALRGAAEG